MNTRVSRYVIVGIPLLVAILLGYFFSAIVSYVLLAGILSLISRPLVDFLSRLRWRRFHIPIFISSLLALTLIWGILLLFLIILVPLLVENASFLATIDPNRVLDAFSGPMAWLESIYSRLPESETQGLSLRDYLSSHLLSFLNLASIGNYFSSAGKTISNLAVGLFSVSFIAFFFLKDEDLFLKGLMLFVPEKYEEKVSQTLQSIRELLVRYFVGMLLESSIIFILTSAGLRIAGLSFQTSVVLGFMAGVLNVIPYIGPMISAVVGVSLGLITFSAAGVTDGLLGLGVALAAVFIIAQMVDNLILQPLIYSTSVNAHPLEVFLVILAAGSAWGIVGMILAIPTYTIFRVIAKQFFSRFEMVQKLTRNM